MRSFAQVFGKHRDKIRMNRISKVPGLNKLKLQGSNVLVVINVDFSMCAQTVSKSTNPKFHRLFEVFAHTTGTPMLVNTSIIVREEPMVESKFDDLSCFAASEFEVIDIESYVVAKSMSNNFSNLMQIEISSRSNVRNFK